MQKKLESVEELDFFLRQSNQQPLLVKFSATGCVSCQQLEGEINKLMQEAKNLLIVEIDVEKEEFASLAQRPEFAVNSIPALFLFVQGKIKKSHRGYLNLEHLRKFIKI